MHVVESVLQLYRSAERKLVVAYVKTGTNSYLFYLKYVPKGLQGAINGKESR